MILSAKIDRDAMHGLLVQGEEDTVWWGSHDLKRNFTDLEDEEFQYICNVYVPDQARL